MHWTYEKWKYDSDLRQGDILEPTEGLLNLFKDVHPHFTQEKYRGFLILTQSCDMVRRKDRGNKCSATHISLSVIRSLQDVISDSLKDSFGYLAPGIYAQHMKKTVRDLVERLVNQNENALGLFYLHPDLDSGITVSSVAILRVAISVRAVEHYHTLEETRVGRLSKEFQPKLGWMVGNLYSRVGVTDWKEKSEDEKENIEEIIIKEILSFTQKEPIWLDRALHKKILKKRHPSYRHKSSLHFSTKLFLGKLIESIKVPFLYADALKKNYLVEAKKLGSFSSTTSKRSSIQSFFCFLPVNISIGVWSFLLPAL